jgi:hypothetical protein
MRNKIETLQAVKEASLHLLRNNVSYTEFIEWAMAEFEVGEPRAKGLYKAVWDKIKESDKQDFESELDKAIQRWEDYRMRAALDNDFIAEAKALVEIGKLRKLYEERMVVRNEVINVGFGINEPRS